MGGGGGFAALRDQRAEVRPLQNLRYQGSEPEHYLGPARGRRRTQLPQYVSASRRPAFGRTAPDPATPDAADVIGGVTMLPLSRRFKVDGHVQSGQLLRA